MDELELLKKDWNRSETSYTNYSEAEIYPMIKKKSSSIVKTLFYISIAEMVFWILINVVPYYLSSNYRKEIEELSHHTWYILLTVSGYFIIAGFIWFLYKSYTTISVTDSAKKLMESILRTRKIVKYYVIYNLFLAFISIPLSFYLMLQEDQQLATEVSNMNSGQMAILIALITAVTGLFIFVFWIFYRILYGILLKRLNRNYQELKKLED
ncbi:hypothetical protein [Winogradskyella aurantiaca]|uniref:hypothetical protein n=1 Tax=Winogradskyella aurantiaca TaxID=2219558 RepID=UPI000E1CF40B|nr:hypothetical protein [Winogradskyella aurantiaca]